MVGCPSIILTKPVQKLLRHIKDSGFKSPALTLERTLTTEATLGYRCQFKIEECHEPLIEIKAANFAIFQPHPHISIGAQYGKFSPYCVRQSVWARLQKAQAILTVQQPGYQLQIYDAYRPLAVQQFMIDHEFIKLCSARNIDPVGTDPKNRQLLMDDVLSVWACPETKLDCPPPHSTGAAIDLTIIDDRGRLLDMGSDIDAIGAVSLPNHYLEARQKPETAFHNNRELLNCVMTTAGFRRLPHEWWHFSYGDQVWALLESLDKPNQSAHAIYGRVE